MEPQLQVGEGVAIDLTQLQLALVASCSSQKEALFGEAKGLALQVFEGLKSEFERYSGLLHNKQTNLDQIKEVYEMYKNIRLSRQERALDFKFLKTASEQFAGGVPLQKLGLELKSFLSGWFALENEVK